MWLFARILFAAGMSLPLVSSLNAADPIPSQQPNSSSPSASDKQTTNYVSTVGAGQPVITIHRQCTEGEGKSATRASSCDKVITREEFENLVNALNPAGQAVSERGRQNLAQTYAEYLAFESAARNAGLEDTPQFREVLDFMRLRTISDLYRRNLQEKYRTPLQEDLDAYYKQHLAEFERVKLLRILVPRESPGAADNPQFDKKALEGANAARARAIKGEDPAQIQKDVYAFLGLQSPPVVDLGSYGRANFVENEGKDVFALKAGEVSPVETEPKSYVIYKVTSKTTLPEEDIKNDISRELSQQKFKDAVKAVTDSAHADSTSNTSEQE
jgi:hypothetical protein